MKVGTGIGTGYLVKNLIFQKKYLNKNNKIVKLGIYGMKP